MICVSRPYSSGCCPARSRARPARRGWSKSSSRDGHSAHGIHLIEGADMDMGLAGRTALITGGSKGIGFAVAEMLAQEGCHLNLVARHPDELEAARAKLVSVAKVDVQIHAMDLAERGSAAALAARVPQIDILVNN